MSLATAGGTTNSNKGHVIFIMWQYALTGMGESIQWYQVHIDDTSLKVGGIQQQKMIDGFVISLNIQHGSPPHMLRDGMAYCTSMPPVKITGTHPSLIVYNPTIKTGVTNNLLCRYSSQCLMNMEKHALILKCTLLTQLMQVGRLSLLRKKMIHPSSSEGTKDEPINDTDVTLANLIYSGNRHVHQAYLYHMVHNTNATVTDGIPSTDCDYDVLQLCFTWLQTNVVKMSLAETTQHASMPLDTILRKHYKSPDPALNVVKHNELVYMDTTWLDAPTIDHGVTSDHNLIVFCSALYPSLLSL